MNFYNNVVLYINDEESIINGYIKKIKYEENYLFITCVLEKTFNLLDIFKINDVIKVIPYMTGYFNNNPYILKLVIEHYKIINFICENDNVLTCTIKIKVFD